MSEIREIALAANHDGRLELVATTDDPAGFGGEVWHAWQTAPNGTWTGWHSFGRPGGGAAGPAAGRNADGRLEVAVVGGDQAVWHRWQTAPNNGWSEWHSLGEPPDGFFGPLALGANADGRLELVAPAAFAGGDQEIWHRWQSTPGGGWSGWSSLGIAGGGELLTSVPVLARNADGRLELFVVAGDGAVWHRWQSAPNNGWSPWANLGSKAGGFADLGVGTNADGRLELFATLQNGTDLWHRWQTAPNNGWSPWANLGSVATGTIQGPTLASNADGRLELFLRAPDTGGLYQLGQSAPNDGWTAGHGWPPP